MLCSRTQNETIGTMTDARWKLGQYFYRTSPLVVLTCVLLRCKPLLPASRECLSLYSIAHLFDKSKQGTPAGVFPPRSKETGLPERDQCEKVADRITKNG